MAEFSVDQIRRQFPQLSEKAHGHDLVYFDNAATALKPAEVIQSVQEYYSHQVANIHRGSHFFGDQGTALYEGAREKVRAFLGAAQRDEIIFTRGTTESINLVASILAQGYLKAGDEILVSEMEHHSNIVPWQLVAGRGDFKIKVVRVTDRGELDLEDLEKHLRGGRIKVVALVHCSNVLGTVNPIREICRTARNAGALTVVDAAQSVTLGGVNVQELGCDFLAFSGHKCFGPTGIGALYGRLELLKTLPPYQGGGSMISQVSFAGTEYLPPPHRYEAGTPHISGAIGLGKAIDFMADLDWPAVHRHERSLLQVARAELESLGGVRFIGESPSQTNILSFVIDGLHPSDVGQIVDREGVAIRVGHHCCQPLMKRMGISGAIRASFSIYNTNEEVRRFGAAVRKAKGFLT